MKNKFDEDQIAYHVKEILKLLGDDVDRPGLVKTPKRVAKAYSEIFEGMRYTNDEIAEMNNVCFEEPSGALVTECNIPVYSMCEHHVLPMVLKVSIGYIPNGKVIGLSKMARIADLVAKRLQLQEKIGTDISYIMKKVIGTEDVIVYIEGHHMCMDMRGIKKPGTVTRTACLSGKFDTDHALRQEFYNIVNMNK